jgi:hypothetical protein
VNVFAHFISILGSDINTRSRTWFFYVELLSKKLLQLRDPRRPGEVYELQWEKMQNKRMLPIGQGRTNKSRTMRPLALRLDITRRDDQQHGKTPLTVHHCRWFSAPTTTPPSPPVDHNTVKETNSPVKPAGWSTRVRGSMSPATPYRENWKSQLPSLTAHW